MSLCLDGPEIAGRPAVNQHVSPCRIAAPDWFDQPTAPRQRGAEQAWAKPTVQEVTPEGFGQFRPVNVFCREYTPISYAIEPFVRSGSLYTLTAKTGAGKTALLIAMMLAVATGREDILGRKVARGRVAYIAAENPDDLRMRIMVAAYRLNIDLREVGDRITILDRRVKPENVVESLALLSDDEPFALVMIDTLAAFFDGDDMNDNVQGGQFMRRLRPLTRLPGLPSVVVAAHPVKNASEDNLVPYGGGAILNEVDGNLTLKASNGLTELHWQGKLRGIEFDPALFRFELATSPDVRDVKDREVSLPVAMPASERDAEKREQKAASKDVAVLRALAANPGGSLKTLADEAKISREAVRRVLVRLSSAKEGKLTKQTLRKWYLTPAGDKALDALETAVRPTAQIDPTRTTVRDNTLPDTTQLETPGKPVVSAAQTTAQKV
jgi:hypothetical protein